MATTIYYPDATAVDGFVEYANAVAWSTARGAATGSGVADTQTGYRAYQLKEADGQFQIERPFLLFNTSALPAGASISAATIGIYVTAAIVGDADAQAYIAICASNPASNDALITADYNQVTFTSISDTKAISGISTSAYLTITLTEAGRNQITKAGISKFCVLEGHDIENLAYAGAADSANQVDFQGFSNVSGNKPKLTVTYTSSSQNIAGYFNV